MPRRKRPRKKRSTVGEGYGAQHKALRRDLLAALIPGTPCPQTFPDGTVCGRPMYATQALHLGHTQDKRGYLGLVHAACNDSAAQLWAQARRGMGITATRAAALVRGRRRW